MQLLRNLMFRLSVDLSETFSLKYKIKLNVGIILNTIPFAIPKNAEASSSPRTILNISAKS